MFSHSLNPFIIIYEGKGGGAAEGRRSKKIYTLYLYIYPP